jgi:hypothetical protein
MVQIPSNEDFMSCEINHMTWEQMLKSIGTAVPQLAGGFCHGIRVVQVTGATCQTYGACTSMPEFIMAAMKTLTVAPDGKIAVRIIGSEIDDCDDLVPFPSCSQDMNIWQVLSHFIVIDAEGNYAWNFYEIECGVASSQT